MQAVVTRLASDVVEIIVFFAAAIALIVGVVGLR